MFDSCKYNVYNVYNVLIRSSRVSMLIIEHALARVTPRQIYKFACLIRLSPQATYMYKFKNLLQLPLIQIREAYN